MKCKRHFYLRDGVEFYCEYGGCVRGMRKQACRRKIGALWALPWFDRTMGSADP
jgi:hypothetical protein